MSVDDVWDNVITPQVEHHYPMADMKILKKYDTGRSYDRFTTTDSCFYFKPQFADISEQQFSFRNEALMNIWLCITKNSKPKDTKLQLKLSMT